MSIARLQVTFSLTVLLAVSLIGVITIVNIATAAVYNSAEEFRYGMALFIAGLVPISLFYTSLYARLKGTEAIPTDGEIDSLYYLGFLITLMTLIVTVISTAVAALGRGDAAAFSDQSTLISVSFAFGLSLAATALALFARVHLSGLKERRNVDVTITGLEEHVSSMILQLDRGYTSLSNVITSVMAQLESASQAQSTRFASELGAVVNTIQVQLESFTKNLGSAIPASGFGESLSNLTSSLKEGSGEMSRFVKSFTPLPQKVGDLSTALDEIRVQSSNARDQVADISNRIGAASATLDGLTFERIKTTSDRLADHLNALSDAIDRSRDLVKSGADQSSASINGTAQEFKGAATSLGQAFISLSSELAKSAQVLAGVTNGKYS